MYINIAQKFEELANEFVKFGEDIKHEIVGLKRDIPNFIPPLVRKEVQKKHTCIERRLCALIQVGESNNDLNFPSRIGRRKHNMKMVRSI